MLSKPQFQSDSGEVGVYLRRVDRSGVKVFIPSPIQISMLGGIIESQTNIPKQHLIFFHGGRAFPGDHAEDFNHLLLALNHRSIIHVRDARKMKKGTITISFLVIHSDNSKGQHKQYSIHSNTNIKAFVEEIIDEDDDQYFLLEGGRKLNLNSTFYDESIEDESTIMVVLPKSNFKNQIKLRNFHQERPFDDEKPNFKKKKNKSICVIPSLNLSSTSESEELNGLARSLRWKKVQSENKKEKKKMTTNEKFHLKEEFQRLLQWEDEKKEERPCLNIFEQEMEESV